MLARVPRDVWIGLGVLAAAVLYWRTADIIPISPLDGVVNAGAMPKALAWALGALAVLLIVRALSVEVMAAAQAGRVADGADDAEADAKPVSLREHLKAMGIAALALAYILALPRLGYVVSVALLVSAASVYGGARLDWRVPATAVGAAAAFYLIFVVLLGIPLPAGFWPTLL